MRPVQLRREVEPGADRQPVPRPAGCRDVRDRDAAYADVIGGAYGSANVIVTSCSSAPTANDAGTTLSIPGGESGFDVAGRSDPMF